MTKPDDTKTSDTAAATGQAAAADANVADAKPLTKAEKQAAEEAENAARSTRTHIGGTRISPDSAV